jgi:FHA domain
LEDDPIAVLLKFGFLAVLYLFLLWVARSALRDMSGGEAGYAAEGPIEPLPPDATRGQHAIDLRSGIVPRLEVVAAAGYDPGTTFEIGEGTTLGRAPGSDVVINDPFASSAHARIFPRGQFMYIEDMGSTNGTFLNGRQLRRPEKLKVADVIRIGDSEYRYGE